MKRTVLAVVAGLVFAPGAASATTICAPSDPAGYYACASVSLQWSAGNIVMSVQNLDAWDSALAGVVGGYRLTAIGVVATPSLTQYLTGTVTTSLGAGATTSGSPEQWAFDTNLDGIFVQAGASTSGGPSSIAGCQSLGNPTPYWNSCGGPILFTFGTDGLTEAQFNTMAANGFEWGMRGISGPNDESFRCFGDECLPTTTVPEPVTMVLFGTGLVGIGLARRRRLSGDVENV
jgi:hypothetical protein